jgi:hypothetical protein
LLGIWNPEIVILIEKKYFKGMFLKIQRSEIQNIAQGKSFQKFYFWKFHSDN